MTCSVTYSFIPFGNIINVKNVTAAEILYNPKFSAFFNTANFSI